MPSELSKSEPRSLMKSEPHPQNAMELIASVVGRANITSEGVAAVTELVKLQEVMERRQAERDFNVAMNALQADIPIITATSAIPNRGKYERFEDIMRVLKPLLTKHGFTLSFWMEPRKEKDNTITVCCGIAHIGGHKQEPRPFTVRMGGKADSDRQADCMAATTAKRRALCDALSIIIQQDADFDEEDARMDGAPVSVEVAGRIYDRLKALPLPKLKDGRIVPWTLVEKKFLEMFGAQSFETIMSSRLGEIKAYLEKQEADAKVPY